MGLALVVVEDGEVFVEDVGGGVDELMGQTG